MSIAWAVFATTFAIGCLGIAAYGWVVHDSGAAPMAFTQFLGIYLAIPFPFAFGAVISCALLDSD